jgi:hypothetical protein
MPLCLKPPKGSAGSIAFAKPSLDVAENAIMLLLADQRSQLRIRIAATAEFHGTRDFSSGMLV